MKFKELGKAIQDIHHAFSRQAGRSVDIALTHRNWLIGLYIKEYEQNGTDRAKYGEKALKSLAITLQASNIPSTSYTSLKQYRQFYETYPSIKQTISNQIEQNIQEYLLPISIGLTVSGQLDEPKPLPETNDIPALKPENLTNNLSYSHFAELIKVEDPLKRSFYEIETIRGNWSARELRRQISTLYYERLGLSKNKEKISKMMDTGTYAHDIKDVIREPYMFEFVGVKHEDVNETTVASALLKHLNSFFLEMGRGFCFEASNKKILIGDQY